MSGQQEHNGLKGELIRACRKLLLEEGYRNCSLRKIAREAGVTATSVYLHFESKDELIHAVMERSIDELNRRLEEAASRSGPATDRLEELARAYVRYALENSREYQVIYLVSSDEMTRYPREKFRRARRGYEIVAEVIREGVATGGLEEPHPVLAAYTLWAQLHGVMAVVLSRRLDSRINQELFIEQALDHILQGYRVRAVPGTE
ncbi:MAG: TetR/AcrR family transcriptional regulator [Balneolaceae bacterium]|nr:TetR/AcrR family transcriptional regulator [Balneolaceae bacterium]